MTTWAIIGGGGVFANHLAKYLLDDDKADKVLAIGRNPRATAPYTLGVGEGDQRYSYRQIHMGFEPERLMEVLDDAKPEIVVNFAALAYATSWDKAQYYYETNVVALAKLIDKLQRRDYLKRFLQIGTSELYGSVTAPAKEDHPLRPTSPYAISKLAGDMHLESMHAVRAFPATIVRPSNCYGPGQQLYRILPRAVWCALTGNKLPLEGGGEARKSFMHAMDLAHAVWLIAQKEPKHLIYNVGPASPVSMRTLVAAVADAVGKPLSALAEIAPPRQAEDGQYWLDSARISGEFGWAPRIDLATGVEDMLRWGRRYLNQLTAPEPFVLRA